MSIDRETVAVYDARAADYAQRFSTGAQDTALAAFIAALPEGATVLDLGCGPGRAAAAMADAGLCVTATDASAEMVRLAGAHPGVTARQASFDDIDGQDLYDGIWANFSLLHAPRADLPRHLSALRRALKPGGLFHIGMKTGTGEARDAIGRLYTYVTEPELTSLLRDAGLVPFTSRSGVETGLDGTPAPWITITSRG
ncbi:class I SAM-dependent methyltransferase [Roseovarius sp. SCSIO 43702]|uniref:class I SAM-dependent DNA methyltransferase n=1 Tax=Roseovarius sp. SCSIO 43702 TaxID=2823043 RepID=UPI001C72CE43|nr:class I SAM-dependent methyltransferase [Roseovarius sp. SCSIO 43702]QYX58262.1 class I SAM-dependent methyltransferase [Roseovarius sp. SCSIO 43702]